MTQIDQSDLFSLAGRVAIITGATRGIGFAAAVQLGRAGASVVVSSEDAAACDRAAALLGKAGITALPVPCDVSSRIDIAALVGATVDRFGRLDVLVCSAGVEGPVGPLAQASAEDITRTFAVNLDGAIALTSAAIPHMRRAGKGSVVLIGSIAGLRGNKAIGVYGLSKAALGQLARNLAVEWGPDGVRANCIAPGLIATDFARKVMDDDAWLARRLSLTPLRRPGRAEEVAAAVLFLASDASGFITGHTLVVDGGTTISDGS